MAKYIRKTVDVWNIYQDCGDGWEVVNAESTFRDANSSVKEYRANMPEYPVKIEKCREYITNGV
jgi:hypothetical protein